MGTISLGDNLLKFPTSEQINDHHLGKKRDDATPQLVISADKRSEYMYILYINEYTVCFTLTYNETYSIMNSLYSNGKLKV